MVFEGPFTSSLASKIIVFWAGHAIFNYGGITHDVTKEQIMHCRKLVDPWLESLKVDILKLIQGNK